MWNLWVVNKSKDFIENVPSKKNDLSPEKPEKKSNSKKWIIFILIAISLGLIWYFNQDNHQTKISNPPAKVEAQNSKEEPVIIEPSSERTRALSTGLHSFEMKAGEETSWLKLPTDRSVTYQIGSPGDEWMIEYSDGTTLKGSENPVLPTKEKVVFKIKSLQRQTVNIKID